jgi:hypothetical protein
MFSKDSSTLPPLSIDAYWLQMILEDRAESAPAPTPQPEAE